MWERVEGEFFGVNVGVVVLLSVVICEGFDIGDMIE